MSRHRTVTRRRSWAPSTCSSSVMMTGMPFQCGRRGGRHATFLFSVSAPCWHSLTHDEYISGGSCGAAACGAAGAPKVEPCRGCGRLGCCAPTGCARRVAPMRPRAQGSRRSGGRGAWQMRSDDPLKIPSFVPTGCVDGRAVPN